MKKSLILLAVLLVFLSTAPAFAATLSVRSDSWMPFNGDPKAANPGYMIEVLKAIFEPKGIKVDYQLMAWDRSKDEVKKGSYDAIVGADKVEAADYTSPEEPFGKFRNAFFVLASNEWKYQGVPSLNQARLGVVEGYAYSDEIDAYIQKAPKGKVFAATGDDALPRLLKMLQAGKIDVILEDATVVAHALKANNIAFSQILVAGDLGESKELFVAFSPARETSKKYSEMFSAGIVELRKSGKLKQILERYNVKDWK